ncbi:CaiB/BaiF CoA transferase family protein [Streptomyces mexicanus]|uniref:CoA transferase n=1 Tax=Streptomyces mexicanus TaxID=178566 RepID=A0A7X1HYK2_9ACTN|nr:CoA transferase [Streptomyces mexicanus]MBC2865025.1 CoA transferase [Streptomyces mexicanus]
MAKNALPLTGVRVLDLTNGKGELGTRLFADLGADVIRVETLGTDRSRSRGPVIDGVSLYHQVFNANKRSVALDLGWAQDRAEFFDRLVPNADICFTSLAPAEQTALGVEPATLLAHNPTLVAVSLTDYGLTGPYRDWAGTEWTHLALGGVLSRSGDPGREPLLPPLDLALQTAAVQAAWSALLAYWNRLETGAGDAVEVSVFESVVQAIDPGWGMGGSATGGVPASEGPRGRIDDGHKYPFFPCADGAVRLTLLSPRQWRGMFAWMGSPEQFADERWNDLVVRFRESHVLYPAIGEMLKPKTRAQIVKEARRYGVAAAAVLTPQEVIHNEHFAARSVFTRPPLAGGRAVAVVDGVVEIDGVRAGYRTAAPAIGRDTEKVLADPGGSRPDPLPVTPGARAPFEGLRVLDLGVIVAGGEAGRLFADLGAEVLKVENLMSPDGSRQSLDGSAMTPIFAWGNRNKLGFGLNLKDIRGHDLFLRLAACSDVVLSNFKPGTLHKLGISYEQLKEVNPGIVVVESSAYGHTGPWSGNPGYGPMVRSAVGVTGLWRYPEDEHRFQDDTTIYPDHVAARMAVFAAVAKLVERRRTGTGGTVHLAQTEVVLGQHAHVFAAESLVPGTTVAVGNAGPGDAPRGVYPAAGHDEWLVVDVQGDDQWRRLAEVTGLDASRCPDAAARVAHRAEIDAHVAAWSAVLAPEESMERLQEAGVPAAKMMRITDFPENPHLVARRTFRPAQHPLIDRPMPSENLPGLFSRVPDPELRPAPLLGQHTREVATRVLGLDDTTVDELFAAGVLQQDPRVAELFVSTGE